MQPIAQISASCLRFPALGVELSADGFQSEQLPQDSVGLAAVPSAVRTELVAGKPQWRGQLQWLFNAVLRPAHFSTRQTQGKEERRLQTCATGGDGQCSRLHKSRPDA